MPVIKVCHLPAVKARIVREKAGQSADFIKDIDAPRQSTTGRLDPAIQIAHLWRNHADFGFIETGEQDRQGIILQQYIRV